MFADEIRRSIEAASRITLPAVTALLWRAYGDGKVTESEAEALSGLIEIRTDAVASRRQPAAIQAGIPATSQDSSGSPRRPSAGSRPRTDVSMERRRRWAASGRLPPGLAAQFTLAEQAVLALVAAEVVRRKDCRLAVGYLAAIVGVAETTVRNAIREARKLGLLTVEERQITGFRNDTNIVRIVSPEWTAWLRLARKGSAQVSAHPSSVQGIGCKFPQRTPTQVPESGKTRTTQASQRRSAPANPPSREASRTADAGPRHSAVKGDAPGSG